MVCVDLYLEYEGLVGTLEAIQARGWRAKSWVTKTGKELGGGPSYKTTLHALVTNPIYLGKVSYRDELYEGEHRTIVDLEVFAAVKKKLNANRVSLGDHDPTDSTLSITLSPLGLRSFATENPDKEESEKS